jgi:hypothetical protein
LWQSLHVATWQLMMQPLCGDAKAEWWKQSVHAMCWAVHVSSFSC